MKAEETGSVKVFSQYRHDFTEEADVAVVGSGPAGAIVARELACAGKRVILLEEGPPFTPADFDLDGARSMARTLREAGLRTTRGYVMTTMQAIALGGGSLINSAVCVRPPDFVFDEWCSRYDLARTTRADLDAHFDAVAEFLGIAVTPEKIQGSRNLLFRRGCDALGYSSESIARNARGCRGSGECFTGCRSRAKQSMDISYIPDAIQNGARVLTSLQVRAVEAEGRRAKAVLGRAVAPFTGAPGPRFRVNAKVVVLAAGCMATPVILQKSGNLANRSKQVGENLQFHPGAAIMGVFSEPTHPQFGATQSYHSLDFLREGFKLETLWAPPALLAVRMPGLGHDLKRRLADLRHAAVWGAMVSCHRSLGRVRARRGSMNPILSWEFHPQDVKVLARAFWVVAELFFAAGARKILAGVHGVPEELHSLEEAQVLRTREHQAQDFVVASNHAFCSTRMHGDPTKGVVDEDGKCHDLENLYIADTGIFPRCTSVNPMFTGMALAHRTAGRIADRI